MSKRKKRNKKKQKTVQRVKKEKLEQNKKDESMDNYGGPEEIAWAEMTGNMDDY